MLAWQAAAPEVALAAVCGEVLGPLMQPLARRCPHLSSEDAAQASNTQPVDLHGAAVQVSVGQG